MTDCKLVPVESRESRMVVLERDEDGTPTVWCDPEIADLVSALNKAGIRTVASCSGHGHRPGNIVLADGRELVIVRDFDEARKIGAMFPGINGEPPLVDVAGLGEALGNQFVPVARLEQGNEDESIFSDDPSDFIVEWGTRRKLRSGEILYIKEPANE